MSFVGDFIGDVVGGITGAKQAGKAAEQAGQLQSAAAQAGIDEQRRQFDKLVELMAPFVAAGVGGEGVTGALPAQQELLGLRGVEAQRRAISGIESSPLLQALTRQGEEALLQRASATGGLRGGNIQAALAQFRPQMLQQAIDTQFANLGGLSSLGQASAAGQASAGMQAAGSIGNLLAQQGAARAGGVLARGAVPGQAFGQALQIGGAIMGAGGFGGFGGGTPASGSAFQFGGGGGNLASMGGGQGLILR
jgi:hypothetical protein